MSGIPGCSVARYTNLIGRSPKRQRSCSRSADAWPRHSSTTTRSMSFMTLIAFLPAALLGSGASLRSFRRARADCSAMPCSTSCTSCRYRMGTNRFCRHSWARSTSALAWLPSVFSCSGHKWPAASSISARAACRNPERSFLSAASWQVDHVERPCASTASSATASIESAIEFATALSRCRTIDANDLADDRAADQGRITTRPAVPPATA